MLWPLRWPSTAGRLPACSSAAPRVPPGGIDDAVAQLRELQELPAVERQLHDLPVVDDVAHLGVGGLQQGPHAGDRDGLGAIADGQFNGDIESLAD